MNSKPQLNKEKNTLNPTTNKYKKFLSVLLFAVTFGTVNAQYTKEEWVFGLGTNAVADGEVKYFFGGLSPGSNWNMVPYPSRITVERRLEYGWSLEAALSTDQFQEGKLFSGSVSSTTRNFYAFNADIKYSLNDLYGGHGWFDPYLVYGFGAAYISPMPSYIDRSSGGVQSVGIGANFWVQHTFLNIIPPPYDIGINLQIEQNWAFRNGVTNYTQYSLGFVFLIPEDIGKQVQEGGENSMYAVVGTSTTGVWDHLFAQIFLSPATISVGTNVFADAGTMFNLLLDRHTLQYASAPIMVSVEKYVKDGFSFELSGHYGQYQAGKMVNGEYVQNMPAYRSADVQVKYHFNAIYDKNLNWLDPYVSAGEGYTEEASGWGMTHNLGVGLTTWIYRNWGVTMQSLGKWGYRNDISNSLQYSFCIVKKFGGDGTEQGVIGNGGGIGEIHTKDIMKTP